MFSEIETWYAARLTELVAPPTRREILEELTESTVALDAEAEMVFVSVAITQLDASADIVAALQVARVGGENTRAAWVGVDARCEVG